MRLISTFARIGVVVLLGLLLAMMMDPANWSDVSMIGHSPLSFSAPSSPWPWLVQRIWFETNAKPTCCGNFTEVKRND